MTLQTIITIILWLISIIGFAGIVATVFFIGRASIKDNPNKALVLVKYGDRIGKPFIANLHQKTKNSYSFMFKDKIIIVPDTYAKLYYRGKRIIFLSDDKKLIASPFDKDIVVEETLNDLIYEICASHVGADGMKAIKGKSTASVLLVGAICLIIGAVLSFGALKFQDTMAIKNTGNNNQIEQGAGKELNPPVKVK